MLLFGEFEGIWLGGDSAYDLRPWRMTPHPNPRMPPPPIPRDDTLRAK